MDYKKIVAHLDRIANVVESRGLVSEAASIDAVSDTIEAFMGGPQIDVKKIPWNIIQKARQDGIDLTDENVVKRIIQEGIKQGIKPSQGSSQGIEAGAMAKGVGALALTLMGIFPAVAQQYERGWTKMDPTEISDPATAKAQEFRDTKNETVDKKMDPDMVSVLKIISPDFVEGGRYIPPSDFLMQAYKYGKSIGMKIETQLDLKMAQNALNKSLGKPVAWDEKGNRIF